MQEAEQQPTIAKQKFKLHYGVRRSVRYHNARRQFFEQLDRISNGLALFFGSSAAAAALNYHFVALVSGALVALVSTINLVLGSTTNARVHQDLASSLVELETRIIAKTDDETTERDLADWKADRRKIEAAEPPTMKALDVMMHNELIVSGFSKAKNKEIIKLTTWQRLACNFLGFNGVDWNSQKTELA